MLVDLFKAIFLGIVEGLTEFIPVSSTAHLLLSSYLIDFTSVKNNVLEIVIQFGAILAIAVIYRKKLFDILLNIKQRSQQKFVLNLILAFLPAAIIGGIFHSQIKAIFFSNYVIGIALIVGGFIMIFVEKKTDHKVTTNNVDEIKPLNAFQIGIFQCIAMIPGVSRSGATIIGGILLGLNRKAATEFSFFLAIPTIAAASFYDLYKNAADLTTDNLEIIFVGLLASFFSAILVVKWFLNFVGKHNFVGFGVYRIIVGILVLLFIS